MKIFRNTAVVLAVMALGATPALALGAGHGAGHGKGHNGTPVTTPATTTTTTPATTTTTTPATTTTQSSTAMAFGRLCQSQSKTHVAGTPGTPFSACVKAMAQVSKDSTVNPHRACATESKKRAAGQKGSAFSRCVAAAAKLRNDEKNAAGA